jgi:hypothetical protein
MRCNICKSDYRAEIDELIKRKVPMSEVARKYATLIGVSVEALYQTLQRHIKKKHPPMIKQEVVPMEKRTHVNFEEYADMLLQEGALQIGSNPGKVTHSAVIGAKRTLIEEAKARNAIDAQKLAFLKFFRGNSTDAEIVDVKQIRGETLQPDTD